MTPVCVERAQLLDCSHSFATKPAVGLYKDDVRVSDPEEIVSKSQITATISTRLSA